MYPISEDILRRFQSGQRQLCRITIGQTVLKSNRIIQGGLSVNRYCTTGNTLMIGACVAAEANLVIDNRDGAFDNFVFAGQEFFLEVGVTDGEGVEQYLPVGYFTIDQSPRKLMQISVAALDRMMRFETKVNNEVLTFPRTIEELLSDICYLCNVTLGNIGILVNGDYSVTEYPENVQTYRDILSLICEVTGTCAYFDWQGKLILGWYDDSSAVTITKQNRTASDLYEEEITVTGVQVLDGGNIYSAGESGFIISVKDNPLITSDWQDICDALFEKLGGFSYTPFSASVLPMPHLYPMDGATFIDKNNNEVFVAITDWTFKLNNNTELRGRGESSTQTGYGRDYGYTQSEAVFMNQVQNLTDNEIGYYTFRNSREIVIGDGQIERIAYMRIGAKRDTHAAIHVEVNLESADTDEDGITIGVCTYKVGDQEILGVHPTETYIDGKHVLHLMYVLPVGEGELVYFQAYMRSESGTITIPAENVTAYTIAPSILIDTRWNGILDVFEIIEPTKIPFVNLSITPIEEEYDINVNHNHRPTSFSDTIPVIGINATAMNIARMREEVTIGRFASYFTITYTRAGQYSYNRSYVSIANNRFSLNESYPFLSSVVSIDSGSLKVAEVETSTMELDTLNGLTVVADGEQEDDVTVIYKTLVTDGTDVYSISNGALTASVGLLANLNSAMFETYGFDYLADCTDAESDILALADFSILRWCSDDTDTSTMVATVSAIPTAQEVVTPEFSFTDFSVTGIEEVSTTTSGNPQAAIKFDNGAWEYYDTIDEDWYEVGQGTRGYMTVADLEDITGQMWEDKLVGVSSFQTKFILPTRNDTLTEIQYTFLNE